jgi:hypothetical protein
MKRKIMLAAVLMCGGILTANAQSQRNPTTGDPSGPATQQQQQRGTQPSSSAAGSGSVSAQTHCWDRTTNQARLKTAGASGGTGSPVAAGSARGSTDRSNPSSPGASGPAGQGTTGSGNTMGLSPC